MRIVSEYRLGFQGFLKSELWAWCKVRKVFCCRWCSKKFLKPFRIPFEHTESLSVFGSNSFSQAEGLNDQTKRIVVGFLSRCFRSNFGNRLLGASRPLDFTESQALKTMNFNEATSLKSHHKEITKLANFRISKAFFDEEQSRVLYGHIVWRQTLATWAVERSHQWRSSPSEFALKGSRKWKPSSFSISGFCIIRRPQLTQLSPVKWVGSYRSTSESIISFA